MVERTGIEPVTPTMSTWCSPAELTLRHSKEPDDFQYMDMVQVTGLISNLPAEVKPVYRANFLIDELIDDDYQLRHDTAYENSSRYSISR